MWSYLYDYCSIKAQYDIANYFEVNNRLLIEKGSGNEEAEKTSQSLSMLQIGDGKIRHKSLEV